MLSLKDFKTFEVSNQIKITGGEYTSHTSGHDMIYTDSNGDTAMDVNGTHSGCLCSSGSFSQRCCSQQ